MYSFFMSVYLETSFDGLKTLFNTATTNTYSNDKNTPSMMRDKSAKRNAKITCMIDMSKMINTVVLVGTPASTKI